MTQHDQDDPPRSARQGGLTPLRAPMPTAEQSNATAEAYLAALRPPPLRFALFYHSLRSDWNHGNAHFLRGVARELVRRGHEVTVYEPADGWSARNLIEQHGEAPLDTFRSAYPELAPVVYDPAELDLEQVVGEVDVVIAHEWNDPALIARLGRLRREARSFWLFFHDTHHRIVSAPEEMERYDLRDYDGVLAFGRIIRQLYLERGLARAAWTWHEAADTTVFQPLEPDRSGPRGQLVWIGNWGDDERSDELQRYLVHPARVLRLDGSVYGVRYPDDAVAGIERAGLAYRGWLANVEVPRVFARHRVTVHVPRRQYTEQLPGIPTIRPFEALACGIPLICAPWEDAENLFRPGTDYLVARDGNEMTRHLRAVLNDEALRLSLIEHGLETIRTRHTCAHRVDHLLAIIQDIDYSTAPAEPTASSGTALQESSDRETPASAQ